MKIYFYETAIAVGLSKGISEGNLDTNTLHSFEKSLKEARQQLAETARSLNTITLNQVNLELKKAKLEIAKASRQNAHAKRPTPKKSTKRMRSPSEILRQRGKKNGMSHATAENN